MLQKEHRLKKKRDIEIVFENGKFVPGELVNAKVWHVDIQKFPKRGYAKDDLKIAVVVGKKVSKRAVDRNKIKRRIREVLRLLIKQDVFRLGNMIVVMAKPDALGATYQDIEKSVQQVLQRAKVLK